MAGTSLLALLDDVTAVLDDVALLTKAAAKKSAGVLGDDLALNANQVAGLRAERELPVVWAVAKGSLKNKAVLVPAALALSAAAPWAVMPLLMFGGLFLCYEGFEKLAHRLLHAPEEERAERAALVQAVADPAVDLVAFERDKIRGAVRTDFILSAEIIAITLGAVAGWPFGVRLAVLAGIAALMTVGVYGLVAAIVKLDDAGLRLAARPGSAGSAGRLIVRAAPLLLKLLSVLGTAAMFLVGGGILAHGVPALEHRIEALPGALAPLLHGALGVAAGALAVGLTAALSRLRAGSSARK